ncbi:ABC transporter permease [Blastococcus saxobsidens]|uniref:Putative glycine betaine/L-proline transport system permease protein proW n=1 Tax=Blastococcus saxobsidens (strain DD2) TaxID=1146883 RepID=H6RJS7_BLASD|nr:ABC transporter permease subunit [Blastococcus saxobsidens]CCG03580.1 putative glycine betaine/L-proline transport system permease protein proW [Blastococcus saxobsidens DD2]
MPETLLITAAENGALPRVPVGDWIDTGFDWLKENFDPFFDALSDGIETVVEGLTEVLLAPPALLFAVLLALLGLAVRSVTFGIGSLLGLFLIQSMDLWGAAMETLSLLLVATVIAVLIAVPLGVAAAKNDRVSAAVRPVLDFMQTMPAFVYLVPAVIFFSIGVVPGVITTIVFALPPGVRLTELGIRQVDAETVEAGHAFGSSPGQILRGIELPLARPTIMAGINQVIMLGLSMAVIAGLIGAGGLGSVVVTSISRLDVGLGFEAGLAVVILAIYLDRLTGAFGRTDQKSPLWRLRRRRTATAPANAVHGTAPAPETDPAVPAASAPRLPRV